MMTQKKHIYLYFNILLIFMKISSSISPVTNCARTFKLKKNTNYLFLQISKI